MSLQDLNCNGWGRFQADPPASFAIDRLNLPSAWEYILQNRRLLLKVDQAGPVYSQVEPPSDIMLFRRDAFQNVSSWVVWLHSPQVSSGPFSTFWRPNFLSDPSALPGAGQAVYEPSRAVWTVEHEGLRCVTEVSIRADAPAIRLKATVTNLRATPVDLTALPVLRPYVNPASLAPWDKPEWYLETGFCRQAGRTGFGTRLLSMNAEPKNRRAVALWSQGEGLSGAEVSYEKFVAAGSWERPAAAWTGRLRLSPDDARPWGVLETANAIYGYPPVYALQYRRQLAPGESWSVRQVLSMLPMAEEGQWPDAAAAVEPAALLDDATADADRAVTADRYARLMAGRSIRTPDAALNEYVNQWLPVQMDWVCSLDRGWPSGMRGSRDSANDFTAMVPLEGPWARQILATLYSCQRSDGWFPRQYSARGRLGTHDLRGHVDAGNWVTELLYHYLCFTKDWAFLREALPWLDRADPASVWDHAVRSLEFYLDADHIGEHGLCKIGEGDWLDSVNRAGLAGRGESVTVTNQSILSMRQMIVLIDHLTAMGIAPAGASELRRRYVEAIGRFIEALRTHAYNAAGYFNSVFNDDGVWVFSDHDPDGQRRVYGPANWFAVASGAAGDRTASVLRQLDVLKTPQGYRLYWPAMGATPIPRVGRGATGDNPAGLWENGNVYNQGSNGFLGRALAVAGRGDQLYEDLLFLLPYDPSRHPLDRTLSPPYAVVNCWQQIPPFAGRGGMTFLTGSIAYGMRMVYEWMLGLQPRPAGLAIDPCVPSAWTHLSARVGYLGKRLDLEIRNPQGRQAGVSAMSINGRAVEESFVDECSGRRVRVIGDDRFDRPVNAVVVTL